MEPEVQQAQLSSPSKPEEPSSTSTTPGLAESSDVPTPPKKTKTRRPRKKTIRVKKGAVNFNFLTPTTTPDLNCNGVEQSGPREPILPENGPGEAGDENKPASTESPPSVRDATLSIATPNERPFQPSGPCSLSISDMESISDEPTTFLLPICEGMPCRKIMPQLPGISDEPTTFILPLCDGPPLPCQSMMSNSSPQPGVAPSGYPMKIVHFRPPPHLVQMGQYFGPPPIMSQFQPQSTPIARIIGPQPVGGQFVGTPHNFLGPPPTSTNTFFRPMFWDTRNPYSPHPYGSPMVSPQMQFPPGFALGPKRKKTNKPSKPRKQRQRKTTQSSPDETAQVEQNTRTSSTSEPLSQESLLHETCPNQERRIAGETLSQTTMEDNSAQETTMDEYLPQRNVIIESFPQETTVDEPLLQETIADGDSMQETSVYENEFTRETDMTLFTDVPDMCNEVEVETLSINGEDDTFQNENDKDEMEEMNPSRSPITNLMSQNLNPTNEDERVNPRPTRPSSTPVKTRRMSHKKDEKKLVFDRKSDAMVKAAKGLFTKRTRTLYTWLYPNTSKREVKVSVSKAWDLLPDSEKAYYLAQVDGRLGIHPGLMVNPQLEGLVKLPEGSAPFKPRPEVKTMRDDSSEDAGSSENDEDDTETARAVRSLFASNGDVDTWASFTKQVADKKKRTKRKSPDASDNERDRTAQVGEPAIGDAELEGELAKYRQILENEEHLDGDDSYWSVMPDPDPEELFLDIL